MSQNTSGYRSIEDRVRGKGLQMWQYLNLANDVARMNTGYGLKKFSTSSLSVIGIEDQRISDAACEKDLIEKINFARNLSNQDNLLMNVRCESNKQTVEPLGEKSCEVAYMTNKTLKRLVKNKMVLVDKKDVPIN